jgi:hypothetical protein
MRILSRRFVDYYDGVSKGVYDEQIVYVREELQGGLYTVPSRRTVGFDSSSFPTISTIRSNLVVGKWVFPLISEYGPRDEEGYPKRLLRIPSLEEMTAKGEGIIWERAKKYSSKDDFVFEERAYELIKLVGKPVFTYYYTHRWGWGDNYQIEVEDKIPILKQMGVQNIIPANEVWQEIYHVLSNVLRTNPDKEPPLQVNNEERIQAAGFDENSFRNPVNGVPRKKKPKKERKK